MYNGTFEQYARAEGVGITADGVAVFGRANISGSGAIGDPIRQDQVLWMGSSAAPAASTGIVEGTMDEVGGPAPGIVKGIEGSLTATDAAGHTSTIAVAAGGTFSSGLAPGTYTFVGHSPLYNGGDGRCGARFAGGDELGDTFIVRAGKLVHVEVVCAISRSRGALTSQLASLRLGLHAGATKASTLRTPRARCRRGSGAASRANPARSSARRRANRPASDH